MPVIVRDGDFTDAKATGQMRFASGLDGVNANNLFHEDYIQLGEFFTRLALNTPHPVETTFVLVEESDTEDVAGGLVRWTRAYARVPDSYSEPGGNIVYTFPGFYGAFGVNAVTVTGRDVVTANVPVRVQHDFFLVGAGQTYTTFGAIPKIPRQRFYYSTAPLLDVLYLADSPPFTDESTPSRSDYEDMIDNEDEIVAEDSNLTRWMGNIYKRETRYIPAQ